MNPPDLDEVFEVERPRLLGLAYRLLGSVVDAEDVVQETWIRYRRTDPATIERPEAWLTTVCGRIGLDALRSRRRRQVTYVGPWLPDPIADLPTHEAGDDPADAAELSDSLTTTFLVLLELLRPEERLAVLMIDVYGEPFSSLAHVLGRSEPACRQLAVRARRRLREHPAPVPTTSPPEALRVARLLVEAMLGTDYDRVRSLLAPEVMLVSDGGREVHAARRPVVGPDRVTRFLVNTARKGPSWARDLIYAPIVLNGAPGFLGRDTDGRPVIAQTYDIVDGRVSRIHVFANPTKLSAIDRSIVLR